MNPSARDINRMARLLAHTQVTTAKKVQHKPQPKPQAIVKKDVAEASKEKAIHFFSIPKINLYRFLKFLPAFH